jgi:hypothetical protein
MSIVTRTEAERRAKSYLKAITPASGRTSAKLLVHSPPVILMSRLAPVAWLKRRTRGDGDITTFRSRKTLVRGLEAAT